MNNLNQKRKFQMPHVFVILFLIMLMVTVLSYIIPSGVFERYIDEDTGIEMVNPDHFQFIENENPIGFMDFMTSVYDGVVGGITIIASLLICSGALAVLNYTGALTSGVDKLTQVTKGKNMIAIVIFFLYFAGMNIMGAGEACYPFFPIITSIVLSLGYDRLMAAGTIMYAATAGFACGMVNMFTTGYSQQLVGLPMFSGIKYRFIVFLVLFTIGFISIIMYGRKIRKNPDKSYMAEEYKAELAKIAEKDDGGQQKTDFGWKKILALVLFLILILTTAYGCLNWGFGLGQFAALYVFYALILGVIFRIKMNDFCQIFTQGAAQVLGAAFAIGLARSVMILLTQGQIMDTIVYYMGNALEGKNIIITLLLIYLFVTALNFLVVSGSGKAVMMMPIMSPLGKMLGINQQVMVLTYQLGDGLTNMLWPGGALVCCSLCGIDYVTWLKMSWKTFGAMILSGFILIVIANAIGYGPF